MMSLGTAISAIDSILRGMRLTLMHRPDSSGQATWPARALSWLACHHTRRVSDQRLRELERLWRDSGKVEDEASYLRERVRVGDLTPQRLEVAAYCGHEAAKSLISANAAADLPLPSCQRSPLDFVRRLPGGREVVVFTAVLLTAQVLDEYERYHPTDTRPRRALEAASGWFECPCERHKLAAELCVSPADQAALMAFGRPGAEVAEPVARAAVCTPLNMEDATRSCAGSQVLGRRAMPSPPNLRVKG